MDCKKILSLLLSLMVALSMLAVPAFADDAAGSVPEKTTPIQTMENEDSPSEGGGTGGISVKRQAVIETALDPADEKSVPKVLGYSEDTTKTYLIRPQAKDKENGNAYPTEFSCTSSDTSVITAVSLDSEWRVEAIGKGNAVLTVTAAGTEEHEAVSKDIEIVVADSTDQQLDWQYQESEPDTSPITKYYKTVLYRLNGGTLTPDKPGEDEIKGEYATLYDAVIAGVLEVFLNGVKYLRLDQAIEAENITLEYGETKPLGASAKTDIVYSTDDTNGSVISLDDKGNITGVGIGTAAVTMNAAKSKYYNTATEKTVTVTVEAADQIITTGRDVYSARFGQSAFSLGAKNSAGNPLVYRVTSGSGVSVDQTGRVSVLNTGNSVVTITAEEVKDSAGNILYSEGSKTVSISVGGPAAPGLSARAIGKRKVQLSWSGVPGASRYQVQPYLGKKKLKAKYVYATSIKNTKLKKRKKYRYKVRAVVSVGGRTMYSPWSAVRTVKVK